MPVIIKYQVFLRILQRLRNDRLNLRHSNQLKSMYDRVLLWNVLSLIAIGLIMVTSTSMPIGNRLANNPFLFAKREIIYIFIICCLSKVIFRLPITFWYLHSTTILIYSTIMLMIVLIIGDSINGASRWIKLGYFHIQPAEFSKLSLFFYLSSYLARKIEEVRTSLFGFLKPIIVVLVLSILLLAQPDFGTVIILFATTIAMIFLAGAKIWNFFIITNIGIVSVVLLIIKEPYRIHRIISFWNPWEDPFGSGYQLTQSLMSFGRGAIYGQGLGNSIQKLEYLPESHTDFIFSIIGEELGYIGSVLVLITIFFIIFRAMLIGKKALEINQLFSGFLAYSIGIWWGLQTIINVSGAVGLLPIKGITLPFISYGGSSLLTMSVSVMILLRIGYEISLKKHQAFIQKDLY